MSQTLNEWIQGKQWFPSPSFNPSVITTVGSVKSMQFMDDGTLSFPGIDNLDSDEAMTYEIVDSILIFYSDDVKTSFGKIASISDHILLLNPIAEESGEVIREMDILFYSDYPTELRLHPGLLSDFMAYSKWNIHAYGKSIELVVGPGGKEYDHSSILREGDHFFLKIESMKLKIMSIFHDRMEVLGIGSKGSAEVRLIKD
jgi:hypothetical protein